jgi:hypothetical protein
VRQTFQWFRDHDVELPANPICGTRLVWKVASQSLVRDILRIPFYADPYVWGRIATTERGVAADRHQETGDMP